MADVSVNTPEKPPIVSVPAWIALAALMAFASGLILYLGNGLNFYRDEWIFIMYRDGHDLTNFISSYAGHLLLWPTALYVFLFHVVGLDHYGVYRVVGLLWFLACALLVFLLARRRVGDVVALAPAGLLLFLGSGWMDILWPMQVVYTGALVFGLGAMLALEREDLIGDGLACLSLTICIGWSGLALPFLPGVAVGLLVRGRLWRRIWVVALPAAAFLLWVLVGGGEQQIVYAGWREWPGYLLKIAEAGIAGIGGLPVAFGLFLLVPFAVLVAIRLRTLGRTSPLAWEALVTLAAFWALTAIARDQVHEPTATRYVYPSAIFLLLLAIGLAPRAVPRGWVPSAVLAAAALCLPLNIADLGQGRDELKEISAIVSAEVGAMQLARNRVLPEYAPQLDGYPHTLLAAPFFAATDRYGSSPGATPAAIAAAPEFARLRADATSLTALRAHLRPGPIQARTPAAPTASRARLGAALARRGRCVLADGRGVDLAGVLAGPGVTIASLGSRAQVGLRRFADGYHRLPDSVPPGSTRQLRIPTDAERTRPWRVRVVAPRGPVRVCGIRQAPAQASIAAGSRRSGPRAST